MYSRKGFFNRAGRVSWPSIFLDHSKCERFWAINFPKPLTLSRTECLILHLLDDRIHLFNLIISRWFGRPYVVQLDNRDTWSCEWLKPLPQYQKTWSYSALNQVWLWLILSTQEKYWICRIYAATSICNLSEHFIETQMQLNDWNLQHISSTWVKHPSLYL